MLIQFVISDIGKILSSLQESFTTREWSIVIWIGIFIIFHMKRSSFRSSLLQIVKLFCSKKILIPLHIPEHTRSVFRGCSQQPER